MTSTPPVTNDVAQGRFELRGDAGTAILKYVDTGDALDLVHTEVPSGDEGKGYGGTLASAALDYARSRQKKVIPSCPFVRKYIQRHTEYADLVTGSTQ